jgi:hypothetical protein
MEYARRKSEEAYIKHPRKPGEGMPIRVVECGEGPTCVLDGEAIVEAVVIKKVDVVVVIDELIVSDGPIDGPAQHSERDTNGSVFHPASLPEGDG